MRWAIVRNVNVFGPTSPLSISSGHGRTGPRANGVSRCIRGAVTIATVIHEYAATAIDFKKLLREVVRIAAHENSSDPVCEARNLAEV